MVRGLAALLPFSPGYPDYAGSLEAAMWHCCAARRSLGPSGQEVGEPQGCSLFSAFEVGLGACEFGTFQEAYMSTQMECLTLSCREVSSGSESSITARIPEGFALVKKEEYDNLRSELVVLARRAD